jgi:hypothetical protein
MHALIFAVRGGSLPVERLPDVTHGHPACAHRLGNCRAEHYWDRVLFFPLRIPHPRLSASCCLTGEDASNPDDIDTAPSPRIRITNVRATVTGHTFR